jgi:hypothetical protein
MDAELLKELGLVDTASLSAIEYAQKCVVLYEQTLRAMGLFLPETISQAVDNSQLAYANPTESGVQYAYVPEHY